jgi:peptidoglycan/LPS O-acetylase OafA/YrhL
MTTAEAAEVSHSPPAEQALREAKCTEKAKADAIHALDGLRLVFAIWVVLYHWSTFTLNLGPHFARGDIAHSMMNFFFITSGYVGMMSAQDKVECFDFRAGVSFVLKRLARLAPCYYLALLCCALWVPFDVPGPDLGDGFYAAFPIQALFAQTLWPVHCREDWYMTEAWLSGNTPGWFASNILILSACFPFLYNIMPVRIGSCFIGLAAVFVIQLLFVGFYLDVKLQVNTMVYISPICRLPEFVAGMLGSRISHQLPSWARDWNGWGWVFDGLCITTLALYAMMPRRDFKEGNAFISLDHILPFVFTFLTISAHCAPRTHGTPDSGMLGRWLSCSLLQTLAKYMYALYILQLPVIKLCIKLLAFMPMGTDQSTMWSHGVLVALPVLGCFLAAVAAFHLFEQPASRWSDAYLRP